jgi:hypothetical protein
VISLPAGLISILILVNCFGVYVCSSWSLDSRLILLHECKKVVIVAIRIRGL